MRDEISVRYQRRVQWRDSDPSGRWQFTVALAYVEEAECELLKSVQVFDVLYGHLPRIYVQADFRSAVAFDDLVEVRLCLRRMGHSSLHYEFEIVREDVVAAEGRLGVVYVDSKGKSAPLPDGVRQALPQYVR